jgi:WD40 repeat protein
VCVWQVSSGKQLERISAHDGLAFGVEFTADGESLVSCGTDGCVHIWNKGQPQATYRDHASRVEALALSPDGRWLATVGKDRTLVVRDLSSQQVQLRWSRGQGTLSSVAFAPDSQTLAVAEASGETKWLRLFDVLSAAEVLRRQHPDGVRSVAFSENGKQVVTSDNGGTVRIWDVAGSPAASQSPQGPLQAWQAHDGHAYAATFEPGGASALSVGHDGKVRRLNIADSARDFVFDTAALSRNTAVREPQLLLHRVAFHPSQDRLFVAAHVGIATVQLHGKVATEYVLGSGDKSWDMVAVPQQHSWIVTAGSTSQDPTSTDVPAVVKLWNDQTGEVRELYRTRPNCSIDDLSCSPDGDRVAVVVNDLTVVDAPKRLLLLDSSSGSVLHEFRAASGTEPRFTPDGRLLVYGVQNQLHVVDLRTQRHRVIRHAHWKSQNGLAISRDGKLLATCDEGREIRVWELLTQTPQAVLKGHQGLITALQFSPDRKTLFSSSFDGTVKAWSVATGQLLMDMHVGSGGVNHMALSRDGSRLAIVEDRMRIRVLPLSLEL